jgi:hypothetical protein
MKNDVAVGYPCPGGMASGRGAILAVRCNESSILCRGFAGRERETGHDLAPLALDTMRGDDGARVRLGLSKALFIQRKMHIFHGSPRGVTPCGRLTYRQMPPAKRKPYDVIAAAQQTLICPGFGRGAGNRTAGRRPRMFGHVAAAPDRDILSGWAWHRRRHRLNSVCAECERSWLTT